MPCRSAGQDRNVLDIVVQDRIDLIESHLMKRVPTADTELVVLGTKSFRTQPEVGVAPLQFATPLLADSLNGRGVAKAVSMSKNVAE